MEINSLTFQYAMKIKDSVDKLGAVTHTYNPSYSGGTPEEVLHSRPTLVKKKKKKCSQDPISTSKSWAWW
jgi:hypothetical protein